jgi:hypothetical protein
MASFSDIIRAARCSTGGVKEDHEREEKKNRGGSYIEP